MTTNIPPDIQELFLKREKLRREGKYEEADKIRDELSEKGYAVADHVLNSTITGREKQAVQTTTFVLFGSGETSSVGRSIHEKALQKLQKDSVNVSLITTPAGFQPNVMTVYQEIADFFTEHLTNFHPCITIVPAHSQKEANDPRVVELINAADYIFTGPGSPTYAVKHLGDTLLLKKIEEKVRAGAILSLSSAATIAFSKYTLPVYEIYKVGSELYWENGLNFFEKLYKPITVIPHFNNTEGGEKNDTSRCYLGRERFEKLLTLLPKREEVWGLDEQTGVIVDFKNKSEEVLGKDEKTIVLYS